MSKLIKYPKKYFERFYSRNGNIWALVRSTGTTLKINRPNQTEPTTEEPKPTPVPIHLVTKKYTLSATNGLFTAFRFDTITMSMVSFDQIATTLTATKSLTDKGFVFEATENSLNIYIVNEEANTENFEWQFTREVAITENEGKQVIFANSKKYDTVEWLPTYIETLVEPPVPVQPVEPPPVVIPPAKEPVKKALETYEFSILLDTGRKLSKFVFNGLVMDNISLSEIYYMAGQTLPSLQIELLNNGNILRMKSSERMQFTDVAIVPEQGYKVGIQEFENGDVVEYDTTGLVYTALTILTKTIPVVNEPLKITVTYLHPEQGVVTSMPITIDEAGNWKTELRNLISVNSEYSLSIANDNTVSVSSLSKYAPLPFAVTTNKLEWKHKTIETKDEPLHVSDKVSFKPGDVVDVELHANIVVDKFVFELPTKLAAFTFGTIALQNTTSDIVKNVVSTHDRINYEILSGNKFAIINRESEPLRIDKVIIADTLYPTGEGRGIPFYFDDSNLRTTTPMVGIGYNEIIKFNSVTINKLPVIVTEDPKTESDCYTMVKVKQLQGYRTKYIPPIVGDDSSHSYVVDSGSDLYKNEEDGQVYYTRELVSLFGKSKSQIDNEIIAVINKFTSNEVKVTPTAEGYTLENLSNANAWQVTMETVCDIVLMDARWGNVAYIEYQSNEWEYTDGF